MTEKNAVLIDNFQKYRHMGAKGTKIQMHRALRNLTLTPFILFAVFILPVFFDAILWFNLENLMKLWENIFNFCIGVLALNGHISYNDIHLLSHTVVLPFPDLQTTMPTSIAIAESVFVSLVIFLLSYFMPEKYLPATYILRASLLIQVSSSLYFLGSHGHPPYALSNYLSGALSSGVYLLFLLTPVLAMIYYIFDISILRKLIASVTIIVYFIIALPFQYMLHAYILNSWSLLFMPVLYLIFGVLLDTLMFVGLYSWAISWRSNSNNSNISFTEI